MVGCLCFPELNEYWLVNFCKLISEIVSWQSLILKETISQLNYILYIYNMKLLGLKIMMEFDFLTHKLAQAFKLLLPIVESKLTPIATSIVTIHSAHCMSCSQIMILYFSECIFKTQINFRFVNIVFSNVIKHISDIF